MLKDIEYVKIVKIYHTPLQGLKNILHSSLLLEQRALKFCLPWTSLGLLNILNSQLWLHPSMDALATLNCFGSMRTTHNGLLHKVLHNKARKCDY